MVTISEKRMPSLISYKYHIRPIARKKYGTIDSESKHKKNVQEILKILALDGPLSTWDMTKSHYSSDSSLMRTKEKEYRRLLIGRKDRGQYSEGILDLNLVVVDSKSNKRNSGNIYRLTLFGILYCFDVLDFSKSDIDKIAKNYEILLPFVFGKWDFLKSIIHEHIYNITLLGKGLLFDNPNIVKIENLEFFELISFFNFKSNNMTQSLNEEKMGELISLWFYTTLMYFPRLLAKSNRKNQKLLNIIFSKDLELKIWFNNFILEAQLFYKNGAKILEDLTID